MVGPISNSKKFYTGVSLDSEVAAYLDRIAREMGWTRSLVLNFILREHARWHGQFGFSESLSTIE
jgi:hypothetical protein